MPLRGGDQMLWFRHIFLVALAVICAFVVAACMPRIGDAGKSPGDPAGFSSRCGSWSCQQQDHFQDVAAYIDNLPGSIGVVMRDEVTKQTWRYGEADRLFWTASSIKLAIATDLLERDASGDISLSAADRSQMKKMLNWSSNDAASGLWNKYNEGMLERFQTRLGMTDLQFSGVHDWGHIKGTANDLSALMSYILDKANSGVRSYMVDALQNVASIQQWGVWGAGSDRHPGNKNGWTQTNDAVALG